MSNGIVYTIDFAAAIARLEEGTVKGARAVQKMADEMEAASNFAKNALASIGVGLSGAAFVAGVKSAADAADAAAKMGDRFGIATERTIGMTHAADLARVSHEGLTNALREIAKSGVEAASGSDKERQAFERLHIQVSEFIKLPMDQQLSLVIDRLGGMENAAVRNATAQALLKRNAGDLMGLVAEGSEAFKKAAADTEAWGLAINRVDAAKIEMANDAITRAQAATKGMFTQISLALSPAVIALGNHFADTKAEAQGYRKEITSGSEIVIEMIGYVVDVVQGLRFAWVGAKLGVAEFTASIAENAFWLRLLPGPLGGAAAALRPFGESFRNVANEIKEELDNLAAEGLPSERIIAKIRAVQATIDKAARELADRRQAMNKQGAEPGVFRDEDQALRQRILKLTEGNLLERDLLRQHYEDNQYDLDLALQNQYITDDFWQGQSMLLFSQYQDAKAKAIFNEFMLHQQKNEAVVNMERATWQLGAEFLQTFAGKSRAAAIAVIAINKALAIAQTISATAVAVMRAFSDLGPIAGAVAAGEIETLGAIQIGLITATGLGQAANVGRGGASVGSPSNPVMTSPSFPVPSAPAGTSQSPVVINVHIETHGNVIGEDGINQLVDENVVPALRDLINDRDVVIIGANSRQAANLVPA